MALTGNGSQRIDLVYDIPYSIKIGNDVGGFTLLALAVKGGRIPVMTHEDMERVLDEFKTGLKSSTNKLLEELYDKTNYEIANHYLKLRMSFSENTIEQNNPTRQQPKVHFLSIILTPVNIITITDK